MPTLPRDRAFDSTLSFLRQPYTYIGARCRAHDSDVFETRLMLKRAVCMMGEEAARTFYEPGRFTRRGAIPPTALTLLQDRGSVQTLDGNPHRHRKAMFMSLMSRERVLALVRAVEDEWMTAAERWEHTDDVELVGETQRILTRAVCRWAGVPLPERDVALRTRELSAMYEGAGAIGPRNWRGQVLRMRAERWIRGVIEQIRADRLRVQPDSAAHVIANHRELDGTLLDVRHAAVELINVLRPTVAVERFITFAALALHEHPEARVEVEDGDDAALERFVQEVRRYYPFFPAVGGRVCEPFTWRGHDFAEGTWVMLDLHGTNHDPRIWGDPQTFRPGRFIDRAIGRFQLIPQGGGEHYVNHRCAGEGITVEIVKASVQVLTTAIRYDVPAQNFSVRMSRMPAVPADRMRIRNVRVEWSRAPASL